MSNDIASQILAARQGRPLVIYAAGGGAEAAAALQGLPHCSKVLVDAGVPYSRDAVLDLIGYKLETRTLPNGCRIGGATSQEAVLMLSWAAWARSAELASRRDPAAEAKGLPIGAAAACTISGYPSGRSHGDEAWLCVRSGPSGSQVHLCYIGWEMGQTQSRPEQSGIVSEQLLRMILADGKPTSEFTLGTGWSTLERILSVRQELPDMEAHGRDLIWRADGDIWEEVPALNPDAHYLLPGSFDPLTHGHVKIKIELDKITGKRGIFQVSAKHPLKGPVPPDRFNRIVNAVRGVSDIIVSPECGMHVDKARIFGLDIACGLDAIGKVSDNHLRQIAGMGRKFILVERPGYVLAPERAALLAELGFPRHGMNLDISSSKLRAAV